MKKLSKTQRNAYPQYIIQIDTTVQGEENTGHAFFQKAAESSNLLDVMKTAEKCIKTRFEDIYIVEIFEKTAKVGEMGEPLYKSALMTRVHQDGYGGVNSSNWHFRTKEHNESEYSRPHFWIPSGKEDRHGSLYYYNCV